VTKFSFKSSRDSKGDAQDGNWKFGFYMGLLLVAGLAFVGGSAYVRTAHQASTVNRVLTEIGAQFHDMSNTQAEAVRTTLDEWHERVVLENKWGVFARDVGIALLISFVVTLLIERYAREKFDKELRTGIVQATFERIIPDVFLIRSGTTL